MFTCSFPPSLQGRALLNAIGNLELTGAYAEALSKLGYELENVACQVRLSDKICFQFRVIHSKNISFFLLLMLNMMCNCFFKLVIFLFFFEGGHSNI